jgi:hypothetical protein
MGAKLRDRAIQRGAELTHVARGLGQQQTALNGG